MRHLSTVLLTALAVSGCNPRPLFLQPRPMREWPTTLQAAKDAVRSGRYAHADSMLALFASRNAGSYEAREAAYWRALLMADPANTPASKAEALRALNQFFADGPIAAGYDEATVLRRILQESDSLSRELSRALRLIADAQEAAVAPSPVTPAAAGTPAAQPENRDNREVRANRNLVEEVHRLRDELAKANQELDRVKKRLSEQRP